MSNNIHNATDVPQSSSGEGTEKIHQEKGSKKKNQQTPPNDDIVGYLHKDKPTSEYDSPSSLQQDYEDILLQQHGNFPEEYDIKFPNTDILCSSQCLDDSSHDVELSPAEDFVSDNYASKSLDHGGGGGASASGAADSILQPTSPIRNYSSDVLSNNNFSNSPASLSSNGAILDVALSAVKEVNVGSGYDFYSSPDQEGHKSRQQVGYDAENYNAQSPLRSPRRQRHNNSSCLSNHSMRGGGITTPLLGSRHRSRLLDSSYRNQLSQSFDDGTPDVSVQVDLSGVWKKEESTTASFLSNSGYEKKRKRGKKSSATDACRKEEPLQHTSTIPFFPSTNAATIESIVNDCGPSAGIANVMSYVYDEACRGQDHLMGALKWVLEEVVRYRELVQNGMSREDKINFLLHTDQQYLAKIVTIMSTIHGGFYEDKLNMGPPLSIFHIAIGILHYSTYNAIKLQTQEDKKNHNLCLPADGCVATATTSFPRVLDGLTNPHLLSGEESKINASDMSIAGNRLVVFDVLLAALPNEVEVDGKMIRMKETHKKKAAETVAEHCNLRSVDELLSVTFGRLILRLELCNAANDKSASVLAFGGHAKKYLNKLVLTTGMATNLLTLHRKVYHTQPFHDGTIATALPEERRKQDISLCSFYSSVVPFLMLGVVYGIATNWDKLKGEEVEAIYRQKVKQGNALGKVSNSAWSLYNDMTDGAVPKDMTEEMIKSIVGGAAWENHKSGQNGKDRAVMIAAMESAYRDMIERVKAENEAARTKKKRRVSHPRASRGTLAAATAAYWRSQQNETEQVSVATEQVSVATEQVSVAERKASKNASIEKIAKTSSVGGRWSDEEHLQFEKGCALHGWGNWKRIAEVVPTREILQIRSHAQKYKSRLAQKYASPCPAASGWTSHVDDKSGRTFYYNAELKKSVWK